MCTAVEGVSVGAIAYCFGSRRIETIENERMRIFSYEKRENIIQMTCVSVDNRRYRPIEAKSKACYVKYRH